MPSPSHRPPSCRAAALPRSACPSYGARASLAAPWRVAPRLGATLFRRPLNAGLRGRGRADRGRHPRATSVVSAAKPGTGFARAAAHGPTAGGQHQPAARVKSVLPSGAETAAVATHPPE